MQANAYRCNGCGFMCEIHFWRVQMYTLKDRFPLNAVYGKEDVPQPPMVGYCDRCMGHLYLLCSHDPALILALRVELVEVTPWEKVQLTVRPADQTGEKATGTATHRNDGRQLDDTNEIMPVESGRAGWFQERPTTPTTVYNENLQLHIV